MFSFLFVPFCICLISSAKVGVLDYKVDSLVIQNVKGCVSFVFRGVFPWQICAKM